MSDQRQMAIILSRPAPTPTHLTEINQIDFFIDQKIIFM